MLRPCVCVYFQGQKIITAPVTDEILTAKEVANRVWFATLSRLQFDNLVSPKGASVVLTESQIKMALFTVELIEVED
jgi:hypothetical protein